ncbi:hypothetical protein SAMN05421768_103698 [Chryseobacterium joostei]|uniref:Uncharacterized protein n=2 Tax=Chryseobacterium joostei TaxID=112234 RepID=A0A1N7IB67_9FLAO|nr:hypothetical protein [Chryseobacterium joostei]SIS34315.1 hypothetical protein SAMN05421768_103698 [Chryseobacterium joostei]
MHHEFWYHSPVRFYRTMEELEDLSNPQNAQYYGHENPYPLQFNLYHRFPIPNYKNEVPNEPLVLWIIGDEKKIVPSVTKVVNGKLQAITFICFEEIQGHFELRTESGVVLYYSNCIQFMDSTDFNGRQFIRIATRANFNKNLFIWEDEKHDWLVTNLPAYNLGTFEIDEDFSSQRTGDKGGSINTTAWLEERVSYNFYLHGDNNILSFITIHSLNKDLYIDGTRRTRREKPEVGEYSSEMVMKFSNQKDEKGLNITINEEDIFSDVMTTVLSNNAKTVIYAVDNKNTAIQVK